MPNARTLHAKQARTVQVNELFAGTILDTATDLDTEVRATGTISATGFTYGPCAWQPTLTADPGVVRIPQAGDPCLIGVDDEGNSWIVQWYGGVDFELHEGWHEVGTGSEPAFVNSWANKGGTYETMAFRKVGDLVYLKGSVASGNLNTTVFTLPAGYRPAKDRRKGISGYDAGTYYQLQLYITTGGVVSIQGTGPSGTIDEAHIEYLMPL